MSGKDKWVRRFSVDETARHKNGFTIYKITSVLFPIESPEAVTVVAVWKRYSDVQRLHKNMLALHAGLHLRGGASPMPKFSYFRRFQKEVIEERAKAIKNVLEFIAEHRLLFTSTEFVNFLQSGYPEPIRSRPSGVIDAIRSALHLPIEETPPLEYQTSDDERSPRHTAPTQPSADETDFSAIPQIPVYEPTLVERPISHADSFESIVSIEDFQDTVYDEISKMAVEKKCAVKKKQALPDLIIFDEPSCSNFDDYHTMPRLSDATSVNSTVTSDTRSSSRVSVYSRQSVSLSNVESKTRTEDSYVFEAGYLLNLAARCEDARDYQRAFECYKSGIEKMLIGVQTDTDPQRRALIKEKTNKYLAYAEDIYKNHLCDAEESLLPTRDPSRLHCPVPLSMLRRGYDDLALYRVLAVLADTLMLVLHKGEQACYAMKVIQKIPNNLTEFDEYFLQRTNETRQPVLPTSIPYMVPLHAYIETNSLIFLILTYAPGEKLLDYIKNYVKSAPPTPARELNLENVFSEPLNKEVNDKSDKSDVIKVNSDLVEKISVNDDKVDEFVELVKNSQRLLQDVDKVLNDPREGVEEVKIEVTGEGKDVKGGMESPSHFRLSPMPRNVLPPSAVCKWGAQILTALESLHNAGVICRDLNPSNILLSDGGQIILTYFVGYTPDVCLSKLSRCIARGPADLYAAPELYNACAEEADEACDYWSFGALLYELICGFPLSYYHKSVFTSHTVLVLPEELSVEVESLLTQLLTYDPAERLGRGGIDDIKRHPYFKQIDWTAVLDSWIVPG